MKKTILRYGAYVGLAALIGGLTKAASLLGMLELDASTTAMGTAILLALFTFLQQKEKLLRRFDGTRDEGDLAPTAITISGAFQREGGRLIQHGDEQSLIQAIVGAVRPLGFECGLGTKVVDQREQWLPQSEQRAVRPRRRRNKA